MAKHTQHQTGPRLSPSDQTDAASLQLDAAAAMLSQWGNVIEYDAMPDMDANAMLCTLINDFLSDARNALQQDQTDRKAPVWHHECDRISGIMASLHTFKMGYSGRCDLPSTAIQRAAIHGLYTSLDAIKGRIDSPLTGASVEVTA